MEHPSFRATLIMYVAFDFLSSSACTIKTTFSSKKSINQVMLRGTMRDNDPRVQRKMLQVNYECGEGSGMRNA